MKVSIWVTKDVLWLSHLAFKSPLITLYFSLFSFSTPTAPSQSHLILQTLKWTLFRIVQAPEISHPSVILFYFYQCNLAGLKILIVTQLWDGLNYSVLPSPGEGFLTSFKDAPVTKSYFGVLFLWPPHLSIF